MPKRVVPEGPGRRVAVLSRTTIEMREKLERAASDSGRSLGQEVEFRLEQSFGPQPQSVEDALGGDDVALLGKVVAFTADTVQGVTGKSWRDDEGTREDVFIAAMRVLRASLLREDADLRDVRALLDQTPDRVKQISTSVSLTLASPPYGEAFPSGTAVRFIHDSTNWPKKGK